MVNAALYPTMKRCLLRLGGVYAITNAMMLHPNVEAVQFRGLFALINLVIPGEFFDPRCVWRRGRGRCPGGNLFFPPLAARLTLTPSISVWETAYALSL